jgi:hypothetical protein
LVWPTEEEYASRVRLPKAKAKELLDRAKECHEYRQNYHKSLRAFLQATNLKGLDSPMLVGAEMARNADRSVPTPLYQDWMAWKSRYVEGLPERDSRAVRVCDFKIREAVAWAKDHGHGLIWVSNIEAGEWTFEYLQEAGIDALHCPSGEKYNRIIADPENRNKIVVASMRAHGTGKNLQHFQQQFFLQWPRQAKMAEQTIGRTHRSGQKADQLEIDCMNLSMFDKLVFAACLNDALYIHQTTSARHPAVQGRRGSEVQQVLRGRVHRRPGAGR